MTPPTPPRRTLHLLYHEVAPAPGPYAYAVSCEALDRQLALFQQRGESSPKPRITFDDGHRSFYEHARPLLERHQIHAHLFITAGWTGKRARYMDWPELHALHRAGHTLGAHGWSHALLTRCSAAELRTELVDAKKLLEDRLGLAVTSLSFPGGRFNRRILDLCREAGYTQMFTSVPRAEPEPPGQMVGRVNVRQSMTLPFLASLLNEPSPALRRMYLGDRVKAAAKQILGDTLYARLWARLNHQNHQDAATEDPAA